MMALLTSAGDTDEDGRGQVFTFALEALKHIATDVQRDLSQ